MNIELTTELATNFIEYAVEVNTDRAFPDSISGLKPVKKRILYTMWEEKFSSAKPHVKCANIDGLTMAYYHPHGESSIYEALVGLAEDWIMRYPLVDWHGNKGTQGGDPPANHRYTEARLSKLAEDGFFSTITKDTLDFIPNYDERRQEPKTLVPLFPNLLCNPNIGIGVAIGNSWLPHNFKEVTQAIIDFLDHKEPSLPGPDFPTGGIIINGQNIPEILKTGHGSVQVRGKYIIENNSIVFTELPYLVKTENLMDKLDELAEAGELPDVLDIRDETDRKGIRLVLECRKNTDFQKTLSVLFEKTKLQSSLSYNQIAIVDKTPISLNLKECIDLYVASNVKSIIRELQFELRKLEADKEVKEGLLRALEDIDFIINLIKSAKSAADARAALMNINYTEAQATAITNMRLGQLAGLEKIEVFNKYKEILQEIDKITLMLGDPYQVLRERLIELCNKYGDERRTIILSSIPEEEKKSNPVENYTVCLTKDGFIKAIPESLLKTKKNHKTDTVISSINTDSDSELLVFTSGGRAHKLPVSSIAPITTLKDKGTILSTLLPLGNEIPQLIVPISYTSDLDNYYILFVTAQGLIKKSLLKDYSTIKRKTGISVLNLNPGDTLVAIKIISHPSQLIIASQSGYVLKISTDEISTTGRTSKGQKGINLHESDIIVFADVIDQEQYLGLFSTNGHGKKLNLNSFILQHRGNVGVKCSKDDKISCGCLLSSDDNIIIFGNNSLTCINEKQIPLVINKTSVGNQIIKNNTILSVNKIKME